MKPKPFQLDATFHEKIWGASRLEPWSRDREDKIGEIRFSMPAGEPLPLMVKFLFTSERLSIQVHPDDDYALKHEGTGGKTEMWYVLAAEPGATLALGFRQPVTLAQARQAAIRGEIEHLVRWWPVHPGQIYFVPAGTVHTLGAGVTVCEIQQNNQITYRLYDYGRPRQLHLDRALDVASLDIHPGPLTPAGERLASCPHFVTDRLYARQLLYEPYSNRGDLLVVLEGGGAIAGEPLAPGQVWYVPAGAEPFLIAADDVAVLLRTYVPA